MKKYEDGWLRRELEVIRQRAARRQKIRLAIAAVILGLSIACLWATDAAGEDVRHDPKESAWIWRTWKYAQTRIRKSPLRYSSGACSFGSNGGFETWLIK